LQPSKISTVFSGGTGTPFDKLWLEVVRKTFYIGSFLVFGSIAVVYQFWPPVIWVLAFLGPLFLVGTHDVSQQSHSVLKNFPIIGHLRYLMEWIRPEMSQYFIETNASGRPFSRELRSVVYQRAKNTLDTLPFGTQRDVYEVGYEWINHSITPIAPPKEEPRIWIGSGQCDKPYSASLLNVSAMSYGSLSPNAIRALNLGAKLGNFAHNTGEGGISPHHLHGGDLIWQVGTGYFGCRTPDGRFDEGMFKERSQVESVKMIEIKLSQGAKPGKGGILPGKKVTQEIAEIRGVPRGQDVISPPAHSAFSTPKEMLKFLARLREVSGGKPLGIKLCVGHRRQVLAICKAMADLKLYPDFISVDGAEGGTGAAPLEFSNSVGMPFREGLIFMHNALVGFNLRDKVKIIGSHKIATGFHMASVIAMGADLTSAARSMMFALGCIQALKCNTNRCPVGVTTQDPWLVRGLVVSDKQVRVANFQRLTVKSFLDILGAAGLNHPSELKPAHMNRRISNSETRRYDQIYPYLQPGELLAEPLPKSYVVDMLESSSESF
jgi:glutamate synthase domain-containing protein 2